MEKVAGGTGCSLFKTHYITTCHSLGIEPLIAVLGVLEAACISPSGGGALDLSTLRVTPKAAIALAEALRGDTVFSRVVLGDCLLNDEGICILVEGLKGNTSVTSLDLRGNNIRQDGAVALASLIKSNTQFIRVTLEWNNIGLWDAGIKAVADALTINNTLRELDLRNNRIGAQGGVSLALAMKANHSLIKLDLRWNSVGIAGGRAFAEMMKYNYSLLYLELAGNDIAPETIQAIDVAIFRNRDAQQLKQTYQRRSELLESDLNHICAEHDHHMQVMTDQLRLKEVEQQQEGNSLRVMLTGVNSQLSYIRDSHNTVESKLHTELHAREVAEARVKDLEEALIVTRREAAGLAQRLHTEVTRERDLRAVLEDGHRSALDQRDFRLREAESAADTLRHCVTDLEAALEVERRRITDQQGRAGLLREENLDLQSKLERIHGEHAGQLASQQEQHACELERRTHLMEQECESLRQQLHKTRKNSESELGTLMQRLQDEEESRRRTNDERLRNMIKSNEEIQRTCKEQTIELTALRKEVGDLQAVSERDRARALNAEHESTRVHGELEGSNGEKQHLQHTLELTQQSAEFAKQEYQRMLDSHNEHLKDMLQQHRAETTNLQAKLVERDEKISTLQAKFLRVQLEQQQRIQQLEASLNSSLYRSFAEAKTAPVV